MADWFDSHIIDPDPERRSQVLPVLEAALDAADPALAVLRVLSHQDGCLLVAGSTYDLDAFRHIYLIGFGKAATPMAAAVTSVLGPRLSRGLLVTKYGHGPHPGELPTQVSVLEAGHPVPDGPGEAAARRIAELACQATAEDLVLCLISGGGSSLLSLPGPGLSLADLRATTDALLSCGATIDEINTVRKHLSALKGGQLARIVAPAPLISLVISDVVGSPLDVIASGPTVPDPSTWEDAWEVLERYRLQDSLPASVIGHLRAGRAGQVPDTPKADDLVFAGNQVVLIADNALAADAAVSRAQALGFRGTIPTTFVEGEAREVARVAVALGRELATRGQPTEPPACLVLGGETTVTLRGSGKGGRNQELALAASLLLHRIPEGRDIVVVSLATDGTDGPTDAAGGLVDGTTVARGRVLGLDAAAHLAGNDAYPFLQAVGDLLVTGPTQTNVNDLIFVFVF